MSKEIAMQILLIRRQTNLYIPCENGSRDKLSLSYVRRLVSTISYLRPEKFPFWQVPVFLYW